MGNNIIDSSRITSELRELLLQGLEDHVNNKIDTKQAEKITTKANRILRMVDKNLEEAKRSFDELKKETAENAN